MSKPAEFRIDRSTPTSLALSGVLSFETAAAALQMIQAALAEGAVTQLDLAGITHGDSAGLASLLAVAAEADRHGHALQVVHLSAAMLALAQVCEVDHLFA
ncbi:MAG TPA: STAS domain-containing protein [Rhodanobacter sp.]|nr:STAS domain-containing protein [Rhodanobacter sp.]